jgi:hypothetical protein
MPKLYIADGVDVDPTFTGSIVTSTDQRNWQHLQKTAISHVTGVRAKDGLPNAAKEFRTRVRIHGISGSVLSSFDAQIVASGSGDGEHTGWQDGSEAQMQVAVSEVQSWI